MFYERNRQTELLIDLNAMEYNYNMIKELHTDKEILPVLKASGYGIGAANVAKFVEKLDIKILGTAFADEAVVLKAGWGYKGEAVVLNQPSIEDIDNIIKLNAKERLYFLTKTLIHQWTRVRRGSMSLI